jgi:hypothetical protein
MCESETELYMHPFTGPVIAGGAGDTVKTPVEKHVVELRNVIMAVPVVTPVTIPVVLATLATAGLLLAHVPVTGAVRVRGEPAQMVPAVPAAGGAVTVTILVVKQPEPAE